MTIEKRTFTQSMKELTSEFQKDVLAYVHSNGSNGATDAEVQGYLNRGHGSTSSALSTLHKNGYLVRLKDKRGRFTIYVTPQFVKGRDIHPPYTNKGLLPTEGHEVCEATEAILILQVEALQKEIAILQKKLRTANALAD